jgi:hypothetical protein
LAAAGTIRPPGKARQKPPLSVAEKHPDFQVTVCLRFVTTNINFYG